MEAIEIARHLAELGEVKDAQNAYLAALRQNVGPGRGIPKSLQHKNPVFTDGLSDRL